MTDYLPIEIDAESVTIQEAGSGWEVAIETAKFGTIVVWMKMHDSLYDQLHEQGVLEVRDGNVKVAKKVKEQ